MNSKATKAIEQLAWLGELDVLLTEREQLRRVYGYLQDAFATTGNSVYLDFQAQIAVAGNEINNDLKRLAERLGTSFGSAADDFPLPPAS